MKKLIVKTAEKFTSRTLAAIDKTFCCVDGKTIVTDINTTVIFNAQHLPDGVYNVVESLVWEPSDFPKIELGREAFQCDISSDVLHDLARFVSRDSYREVLTGLGFNKRYVYGTDAWTLKRIPCETPDAFCLPMVNYKKIKHLLVGNCEIWTGGDKITLKFEDYTIILNVSGNKYVDANAVIPAKLEEYSTFIKLPVKDILATVAQCKKASIEFNHVEIHLDEKVCTLRNIDFGFEKSFPIETSQATIKNVTVLTMPFNGGDMPCINPKLLWTVADGFYYNGDPCRAFVS